jgi:PEP-CTERM motif
MRAVITQAAPSIAGSPLSDSLTQFDDTVFFTNTTGSSLNLDLTYSFDGTAAVLQQKTLTGLAILQLLSCGNASGERINFASTGKLANVAGYSVFDDTGVTSVYDQFSGQTLDTLGFTVATNTNGIGSILKTTLVIPVGETSLGIRNYLFLQGIYAASADFGHTSRFNFGPLANGLSFTSASGVFLRGNVAAAVPEPATWAMMLFGFALIGSTLRRRIATRISALA